MLTDFFCEACHAKGRIDLADPKQAQPLPGWRENLGQRVWIVTCPASGCGVRSEVRMRTEGLAAPQAE